MNLVHRIWLALFGPYMDLKAEKTQVLMQRGYYGQLVVSAQDEFYAIQVQLNREQVEEMIRWLQVSGRGLSPPNKKNNLIRFPTQAKVSPRKTDK